FLARYEVHAEAKSAGPDGSVCGRDARGLLARRHVAVESVTLIGKESNSLDEVEAGAIHDPDENLNTYSRPVCQSCSTVLTGKQTRYCSPRCQQAAYRQRRPY